MAIAVYFHPKNLTMKDFEETHRRLQDSGDSEPDGRIHHSCFGPDGDLMVYDIWESPEAFEAFGQRLMPVLAELGIDAGEPAVMPIHRLEQVEMVQAPAG
jgi:hypothetical protein